MNFYFNITLLPDAEMKTSVLMSTVFSKLHKRLTDLKSSTIGVSFPKYCVTLGTVLRLHGNELELRELLCMDWLGGMKGYCTLSDIMPVPREVKYRIVQRRQPNMSQAKLKRAIKQGSLPRSKAMDYENKMRSKHLASNPPYLDLVSGSNNQRYRRYVVLGDLLNDAVPGEFDQFGFSKTATVPWF